MSKDFTYLIKVKVRCPFCQKKFVVSSKDMIGNSEIKCQKCSNIMDEFHPPDPVNNLLFFLVDGLTSPFHHFLDD